MASRMGAQGIEIDARGMLRPRELTETGRRQLRRMLDDLNLRVAAVRFMTRRGYDCPDDLDRRMEATREAMKFAYSLGANVVINAVGPVGPDEASADYQRMKSCLEDIAGWGQRLGAMLACETGTEPVERLVDLLQSLRSPTIGIALNPGNLIVNQFYDPTAIEKCGQHVLTVVARDAVRDVARGRGMEVPLGAGTADFPHILGALEQFDYRGWLLADRLHSEAPESDLQNAVKFLQRLQS